MAGCLSADVAAGDDPTVIPRRRSLLGPTARDAGSARYGVRSSQPGRPQWSEQTAPTIYHLFRWARVRRHDGAPVDLPRLSYVHSQPDHAGPVMSRVNFHRAPTTAGLLRGS